MEDILDSPNQRRKSKRTALLKILSIVVFVIYAGCTLLAINDIFTIVYSGPVIAGAGLVEVVASLILKEKIGLIAGSWTVLSVLTIFLLIYFFEIPPLQAVSVVPVLAGFSLLILFGLIIGLFVSLKQK